MNTLQMISKKCSFARELVVNAGFAVAAIVFAVPAFAQEVAFHGAMVDANAVRDVPSVATVVNPPGDSPTPEARYGTSAWAVYNGGPCDAVLRSGSWSDNSCFWVTSSSSASISIGYPVHIPTGAVAQYSRIFFNQTNISNTISAGFWKADLYGGSTLITGMSPTATTVGNTYQQFGPFNEVVDNAPNSGNQYVLLAITSGTTRIYKMMIYYKLAVSPAPGTATFSDVPTSFWAFQHIQALVASGITSGCGGGNFCPNAGVTRAEMAVFLAKALGLHYEY
jgi:hypothetical protein